MKIPSPVTSPGSLLTEWGTPDFTVTYGEIKEYHYCGNNVECKAYLIKLKQKYKIYPRETASYRPPNAGMIVKVIPKTFRSFRHLEIEVPWERPSPPQNATYR